MHNRGIFLRTLFIASPLLAAGCSGLIGPGEGAAYSKVPVGSVVRIERRIPVATDRARVWLRGDRTSTGSSSNSPICGLEVSDIDRSGTQFIDPGVFRVRRVQNMWTEIVQLPGTRGDRVKYRLANVGGGDGGTPMIYEGYHLWLESEEQPNVMRMTCIGVFADMWEARPPTIEDIRASLGILATLEIAGAPPR